MLLFSSNTYFRTAHWLTDRFETRQAYFGFARMPGYSVIILEKLRVTIESNTVLLPRTDPCKRCPVARCQTSTNERGPPGPPPQRRRRLSLRLRLSRRRFRPLSRGLSVPKRHGQTFPLHVSSGVLTSFARSQAPGPHLKHWNLLAKTFMPHLQPAAFARNWAASVAQVCIEQLARKEGF